MIDIEKAKQFSTLLDGLLNPNEDIRIQAENSVMEQINKDYISTYCYSIYKMKSKNSRKLGAIIASNISKEIRNLKQNLNQEKVEILEKSLEDLLVFVMQNEDKFMSQRSALIFCLVFDAVGHYRNQLMHEFLTNMSTTFDKSQHGFIRILSEMAKLSYFTSKIDKQSQVFIIELLKKALIPSKPGQSNDPELLETVFEFLSSLAEHNEEENIIVFSNISSLIVQKFNWVISNGKINPSIKEKVLESLETFTYYAGKLCFSQMSLIIDSAYNILNLGLLEPGACKVIREIVINTAYIAPSFLIEDKKSVKKVLLISIGALCPALNTITEAWLNPSVGDKFIDDETTESLDVVNRVLEVLESEAILALFSAEVQSLLQRDTWTHQYAAIMALSQVGEHVKSVEELSPIVHIVKNHLNHGNPMVRNACLHCLAQFCEDKKGDFQKKFKTDLIEWSVAGLKDSIIRVRGYAAACLSNFLDGINPEDIKEFTPVLLTSLLEVIGRDNIFVVNSVIACISSFAMAIKFEVTVYYKQIYQALTELLNKNVEGAVEVSCRIIECLSICYFYTENLLAKEGLNDIIYLIKYFQGNIINLNDQRIYFLLLAWKRLIKKLNFDGKSLTGEIFVVLKKVLEQVFQYKNEVEKFRRKRLIQTSTDAPSRNKVLEVDSFSFVYQVNEQDIIASINLLLEMMKFMNFDSIDQINHILQAILICAVELPQTKINLKASECLVIVLRALIESKETKESFKGYRINLIYALFEKVKKSKDPAFRVELIKNVQELIEITQDPVCSDLTSFNNLLKYLISLIELSIIEIKKSTKKIENDDIQIDQNDIGDLENLISFNLITLKLSALIMEFLLKTHPGYKLQVAKFIVEVILKKVYEEKEYLQVIIFSRKLLVSMLRACGRDLVNFIPLAQLSTMIFEISNSYESDMVKTGIEALGDFCTIFKADLSLEDVNKALNLLEGKQDLNSRLYSPNEMFEIKDFSVYSVGQILHFTLQKQELNQMMKPWALKWLKSMPFSTISGKMKYQTLLIADLMESNTSLFIEDDEVLVAALKLFGKVYKTERWSNEQANQRIEGLIKKLSRSEVMRKKMFQISGSMNQFERAKFMALIC